tara:strand:- start:974 stop:1768 length:795 start_codon:yes stop_codon:yes gene_type:complete
MIFSLNNQNNNQNNIRNVRFRGKNLNLIDIKSKKTNVVDNEKDNIYMFTQFYIPGNTERYGEIKETLKENVQNNLITKIILINERKYTEEEMGINNDKIIQIIKGDRMTFLDVFKNIKSMKLKGYIVVTNSDIFFNNTFGNIFRSNLMNTKKVFSLLRLEYNKNNLNETRLYKDYNWSADTWIFHTNQSNKIKNVNEFNLQLGFAGVDNILPYKFYKNGFSVFNEPLFIQTLHNHHNDYRTWKKNNLFANEYYYLCCRPNLINK